MVSKGNHPRIKQCFSFPSDLGIVICQIFGIDWMVWGVDDLLATRHDEWPHARLELANLSMACVSAFLHLLK